MESVAAIRLPRNEQRKVRQHARQMSEGRTDRTMLTTDMLYNEDCLQGMRQMPDECIDLVVTDCPYKISAGGVTIEQKGNEMSGIMSKRSKHVSLSGVLNDVRIVPNSKCGEKWIKKDDSMPSAVKNGKMFTHNDIQFKEWLPEVYRILKPKTHCYIMINARNLKDLQTEAEKVGFKFQNLLIWDKKTATPNKFYMQGAEFILMLRKGGERWINDMGTTNILRVPNIVGNKRHPTEKPVSLMAILINNSSKKGDIVFDPFAGSGSTLVAAMQQERHYIGYEVDEQFYQVAADRLSREYKQPTLFD